MDTELKKYMARMLSSEDQVLSKMTEIDMLEILASYERISNFVEDMPEVDACTAKILLALGFGKIIRSRDIGRELDGGEE